MRNISLFAAIVLAAASPGWAAPAPASQPLVQVGCTDRQLISELSGLAPSSRAGWFWALNDSLHPAELYLVERTGRCVARFPVAGAMNIDWEALAGDGRGHLYIGDIGNNLGLAARQVYKVREPDLGPYIRSAAASTRPAMGELAVEAVYTYSFVGKPFDAEAMFVRDGRLFVISKVRGPSTKLYEVDLERPGVSRPLREICTIPQVQVVTDASLSADGRRLAVCGYTYVAVFALDPAGPIESLASQRGLRMGYGHVGVEGCCWEGPERLLLGQEGGPLYGVEVPVGVLSSDKR